MLSPTNYLIKLKKTCNFLWSATKVCQPLLITMSVVLVGGNSVLAQSITPNHDGTGTVVNSDGNTVNIDGGSLSEDGKNLFHSFEQFGLSEEQIANFMSNPNIANILGRINGGDPSVINGLIQVTGGNSNLLLMNPAGIIFGDQAQLNVPGDFTATTATGIGFEDNAWFNAVGENNYQSLIGTPTQFAFDQANPGAIINNGELSLDQGNNLTLLGGNVINTGEITAPAGSVTLSAIPGSSTVRISQAGHLLSLDIEPPRDDQGHVLPFTSQDLPALLTSAAGVDAGLTPNQDGSVTINDAGTNFIPEANMAIASGTINVSGLEGGEVNITGNKVGVFSGNIDATGINAGGTVRVGGDFQGGGDIPNATNTIVDDRSAIAVDATDNGDGGVAIAWSDSLTQNAGKITARGGENGGNGGLVEISGKDSLVFTGTVDAGADLGQSGELLLDPRNITISDSGSAFTNPLEFNTDPDQDFTIAADSITNITNTGTDVTLQANNDIVVTPTGAISTNNPSGDGGNITLQAGRRIEINADITTDNGDLTLIANETEENGVNSEFTESLGTSEILTAEGVTFDLGSGDFRGAMPSIINNITVDNITANNIVLETLPDGVAANIGDINVNGSLTANNNIRITASDINLKGGANSVSGQTITLEPASDLFAFISIGNEEGEGLGLDLSTVDIAALADGFDQITIGRTDGPAGVTLYDTVADGGTTPFQDPVNIPSTGGGTSSLTGTNLDTTWEINNDSGNLNSIFANGLTFGEFFSFDGGSGNDIFIVNDDFSVDGKGGNNTLAFTDSERYVPVTGENSGGGGFSLFSNIQNLQGGGGDETFDIRGEGSISGNIDGGGGNDTLDYEELGEEREFAVDLEAGSATGVGGTVSNINQVLAPQDAQDVANFPDNPDADNTIINNSDPIETNPNQPSTSILPTRLPEIERRNRSNQDDLDNEEDVNPDQNSLAFNSTLDRQNIEIEILERIDADFTQGYENYFGRIFNDRTESSPGELGINLSKVQQTLKGVEKSTGAKPALIYVAFFPSGVDALQGRNSNILPQADDRLELITITKDGQPIRKPIEGVTRAEVDKVARQFSKSIFDEQPEKYFLPHAQQLYKWIIEPIKEELDGQKIDNLVFLMDSGLRTIPIAALHDGSKYLVEKYSVGLMPSLNLTDTRYQNIKDLGLLAMGSKNFPADPDLFPLPAVPVEVNIITQQLWSEGTSFLDKNFTIANLKEVQASKPFGILHLATHAEFIPGTPKNSYIQFGDRKLRLDKVRELSLNNPQVELMVLSACKTALGDTDAEYGFAGLAHQAGVKSALGSLWYVSDQGTLAIMSKFYQELKNAPIKAEALRRAQIAMINKTVRLEPGKLITATQTFDLPKDIDVLDITHPRYWSSFTIIGNPW
jgi:filamentous hemagglutinin family protein